MGRELQEKVIHMILDKKDKDEVFKYVKERKEHIKTKATLEEMGVPATLSKALDSYDANSQHLKAARYSNKYLGKIFGAKDKLLMVFVKTVPYRYEQTNVIALEFGDELPDGFSIDYEEHVKKNVEKLTDPIFEAIEWDMNVGKSLFEF
jgi:DNA polymerase I